MAVRLSSPDLRLVVGTVPPKLAEKELTKIFREKNLLGNCYINSCLTLIIDFKIKFVFQMNRKQMAFSDLTTPLTQRSIAKSVFSRTRLTKLQCVLET